MFWALLIIVLVFAVLVLASRLHELRQQFSQVRHERDVFEKIYNDWIYVDLGHPGERLPKNYRERPKRSEWDD